MSSVSHPIFARVYQWMSPAMDRAGVAARAAARDAPVCLVLCSVPDQASALAEIHRVLRPGGQLRFFEHVRHPASRRRGRGMIVARTQAITQGDGSGAPQGCRRASASTATMGARQLHGGFTVVAAVASYPDRRIWR